MTSRNRHEKPCTLPLSSKTCIYLADGSKVVIRRGPKVKGPVWMEVVPQEVLRLESVVVDAPPVCRKCWRCHRGTCPVPSPKR